MKPWLASCLLAGCAAASHAQDHLLWQIGVPDRSSREFHDTYGVDYANPASDVDYHIGQNTAKDWLRFQPGPANGLTGARLHPFRIHFQLSEAPRGTYLLKIATLYETPRMSALRLDINGHAGQFTFSPQLDYSAGDWEGTFVPQTSHADLTIAIASSWLHTGENIITLTAIDDPATSQQSLGDIAPGVSGIVYDALSLVQQPVRTAAAKPSLRAEATVFFRHVSGTPREIVRACVVTDAAIKPPQSISWKSKGYEESQPLHSDGFEFGECCASFDVPEWTGTLHATLRTDTGLANVVVEAQKKWTVLVVPHEHLDIGFTDYREKVAELQSQSIDGVLDLLPQHPDFRWTMDGSWVAQQFLATRSAKRTDQFLSAVRAGQIVIPQQYSNQHTGVASLEGLARSLYYSHSLARTEHVPLGAANITDVPSYSWSYASILHDAGVKYFAAASNSWRAPVILQGHWNEKSPFYWEGPDGGRVLMWYSRAYLQLASMFGTPPTIEAVHDALPVFLQAYTRKDYRAHSVILFGSQLENTTLDRGQITLPTEWAKQYDYPRLEFSTFRDALASIEQQFEGTIPTYRGDFGPYWEDGFTSDARSTATHRTNQQRILSAEILGTIPSLLNASMHPDAELLRDAWQNSALFDEHTWTSVAATTQPEGDQNQLQSQEKRTQANRAAQDITYSIERSFGQLESMLSPKDNSILIVNSLSWPRSAWLETDLPEGKRIIDPTTGKPVPQEVLRTESGTELPGFGGRTLRVRYRVDAVPPVGYKLLSILDAKAPLSTEQKKSDADTLENGFYRITLDAASGSIRSIWDKQLQREVVDASSPYRFASYVYVTGADDMPNNSLYRYGVGLPRPQLDVHMAAAGRIVRIVRGAASESATLESSAPNTPSIQTQITLPGDVKRIDISVSFKKEPTLRREAVYIAFPFRSAHPSFAYDTQNGWVDPAKDELPGGSREWYTNQHWAAVRDSDATLAVIPNDAPLVTFGDIVRGDWPSEFKPRSSALFSWLMSNYWSTNFISSQGGAYTFHYTIVSSPNFKPEALTRLGMEQMTPLESDTISASATPSAVTSSSFLTLDNENVALSTWKLAEDGNGSILRLVEISGRPQIVHLTAPHLRLVSAERCSLVEDCQDTLQATDSALTVQLQPFQILTLKLHTEPETKR